MAQLLANLTKSGLAAVPDPALETSDDDNTRDILRERDADSTIAITQLRKALVSTVRDVVNFAKRCKKLANDVVRDLGRAVTEINNPRLGSSRRKAKRNVVVPDPGSQDTFTVDRGLERQPDSTITEELHVGQQIFIDQSQQFRQHRGGTHGTINGGRKKGHQAIRALQ